MSSKHTIKSMFVYCCLFVGGIPKSKSIEMIEEETMQQQRETPVSVPPIPPSPRGEKQFAGKSNHRQ